MGQVSEQQLRGILCSNQNTFLSPEIRHSTTLLRFHIENKIWILPQLMMQKMEPRFPPL